MPSAKESLYLVLIIASIAVHQSLSQPSCLVYKFVETKGTELANHIIQTMTSALKELCWDECVNMPMCFSLNVRKVFGDMYECDLNNSTVDVPSSPVPREGSEYHEMADVDPANCKTRECAVKKVLKDGWYTWGSKILKLFKEKKNWTEALDHCKANGGSLVSITSLAKNLFVYDVLAQPIKAEIEAPPPGDYYLALDGHDTGVSFIGSQAKYRNTEGETSLFAIKDSMAHIPYLNLDLTAFTLAFTVRIRYSKSLPTPIVYDTSNLRLLWNPVDSRLVLTVMDNNNVIILTTDANVLIKMKAWYFLAFTWDDLASKKAAFFVNGEEKNVVFIKQPAITIHSQASFTVIRYIFLKRVMTFGRALTMKEIYLLKDFSEYGPWIGLSDLTSNKLFGWSDGTNINNYIPLPVYNATTPADVSSCVAMGNNGKWINKKCDEKRPFICQKSIP